MSNFKGYLLKATKTGQKFPSKYIKLNTWDSTPKQIEYLKAYRDDNTRNLTKVAAKGRKSTFKFTSIPGLNLSDREVIKAFFYFIQSNNEGDIELEYWDDKSLVYRTGNFYQPNMHFKIVSHTAKDIIYDSLEFEFIEN